MNQKCLQDKLAVQAGNQQYKWIYIQAKRTDSLVRTKARQACRQKVRKGTDSLELQPEGTDSLEYKKININMDNPHVGR